MSKNTKRRLYLLFPYNGIIHSGYSIVYKHSFLNDEYPYIMVSYWGIGEYLHAVFINDGESVCHYLIRTSDAADFVAEKKICQDDYLGYYLEGIYTRQAGEHNLSARDYADGAKIREPRVKFINNVPF